MLGGLQVSGSADPDQKTSLIARIAEAFAGGGKTTSNRIDRLWMEGERFDEIVSLCNIANGIRGAP